MACDTMNCSHNCMADRDSDEADRENSDHENYSEASQMIYISWFTFMKTFQGFLSYAYHYCQR